MKPLRELESAIDATDDETELHAMRKHLDRVTRKLGRKQTAKADAKRAAAAETPAPGIFIEAARDVDANTPLLTADQLPWLQNLRSGIKGWASIGFETNRGFNQFNIQADFRDIHTLQDFNSWELGAQATNESQQWAVETFEPGTGPKRFLFWALTHPTPAVQLASHRAKQAEHAATRAAKAIGP